ncbi:hypothetical protein [Mucilaginibacter sp. SJ]|uniref:hypothetical protein n=1 Tax=Mucilaginibacter sp. SJ TaxID=3029053 RepID=UPI0023A9BF6C|nr:hypothetical protein [Mucilaginibacter sp. SJ]WEA00925.1 hypothetical protein MusilaSJ_26065 [Mucilaginibacter sp. SJ]
MPTERSPYSTYAMTEGEIVHKIKGHLKTWNLISTAYNYAIYILGFISISTSVFVAGFIGVKKEDSALLAVCPQILKICAIVSSISLTLLTAFNIVRKSNDTRKAWRILNTALLFYHSGKYSIDKLIEEYYRGEEVIGTVDFNFNSKQDDATGKVSFDNTDSKVKPEKKNKTRGNNR